jgi:lipopolysaccharide export LptBFGC system permease protein LptF
MRKRVKISDDPASSLVTGFARRKRAEFTDEGPAEDDGMQTTNDEEQAEAPSSLGGAKTPILIAILAAVATGAAIWWKTRTVVSATGTSAEDLAAEGELARYEAEKRQYESARVKLQAEHGALVADRDATTKALQQLRAIAEDNNGKFKKLYAPAKASFDSEISSYEEEQNIETAFALKNELDEKKSAMLQKNADMGKQHAALLARLRAVSQRIEQVEAIYNESFDNPIG